MIQVMKISGKYFATDISNLQDEDKVERLQDFIDQSISIILVLDLVDLWDFGINPEEVETVILEE